jgi:hypothetical protein
MHLIEMVFQVSSGVLLAVAGWSVAVFFSPYRKCRWCAVFASLGMRCRRCKGTRLTRRLGARQVHKVRLSLRQAREER